MRSSPGCPVCGATARFLSAGTRELRREADLRAAFVLNRLDHPPDALELTDLTRFVHGGPGRLWSCSTCGLLSRDEQDQGRYEHDVYDRSLMQHLYPRYVYAFESKQRYRFVLDEHAEVLEIGSHLGAFVQTAEQWNWRPTGLDIGGDTSSFARRHGLCVKRLAIEDYQPRRRMDGIFIWNCFEQLQEPVDVLMECHRLLQRHRTLMVRVPNAQFYERERRRLEKRPSGAALSSLAYNNLLAFPYLRGYTPGSLMWLLRSNGFLPVSAKGSTLLTPPYPALSPRIEKEWRAMEDRVTGMSASDGPWIEVLCRRAA